MVLGCVLFLMAVCGSVGLGLDEILEQTVIVMPFYPKVYGQKNGQLTVNCHVTSQSPILEYDWFKDGEKIVPQKRVYIASNGSLIFSKLVSKKRKSDTGHYDCYATNEFGTLIGAQVDILIEKQSPVIEPKTVEVEIGGIARFQCYFETQTSPLLYLWAFKDRQLKTSDNNKRIFIHDGVLQIHNVSSEDEGMYDCTAFKTGDEIDLHEESAFLKIKSGPLTKESRLLNTPQNITVISQEPALLECLVQGQEPVTISWKYPNGSTVFHSDHVTFSGSSNLQIKETNQKDSGQYTCIVTHRDGSEIKRIYNLSILVAPELTKYPLLVQQNLIAQRARLPCIVTGNPEPEITWYKNGLRIFPPPGVEIENELVLHGRYEDNGYYQCVAKNPVKTIIATAWVGFARKDGTPGVVKDVFAQALSPTNVSLHWSPAQTHDSLPMVAYVVHFHELQEFECPGQCTYLYEGQTEVSKTTSLIIKNLKPYTQYSFNVQGFSTQGAGVLSKGVVVRTLQSVPSGAPDLQISPDSPTSFRIAWTELPKSQRNGLITQYKVSVEDTDIKRTVIKLPGDKKEFLVTGLEAGREYKVQVLAGTSVGFPKIDDNWITYTTPNFEYGDIPTPVLVFEPINSSTVLIKWNNNNHSNVGSFRIVVKDLLESVPIGEYNLPRTASQCLVTGLENRTFYEIDLMVKSRTSNAVKTVKELYQSLNPGDFPEPPPPMVIKPTPLSSTNIKLQWEKPKTSLPIVNYTVRYQQREGEEMFNIEDRSHSFDVDSLGTVINNLQPYTWYFMSIRSKTENVAGPYSRPVLIQTLEGIPSPPENVLAEVVSPGKVKLQWGPPSKQNGVITYYIIYYNSDKNVPDNSWASIQQNGSTTTLVVEDLTSKVYYFKLRACTNAGESQSTDIIEINTLSCVGQECPVCEPPQSCIKPAEDQEKLGIIIGCAVGLVCIIVCSVFVIVRHRQLRARYRNSTNVHLINTSNGQNVGLYLSQQPAGHPAAVENSYSPILHRLPENEHSDTKGDELQDKKHRRILSHHGPPSIFSHSHHALAAEQRALLSAGTSSSSSQSNETSEDLTPDLGTLDSSPTSPEAYYNVSYSKINNCRMFEGEDLAEVTPPTLKYSDDLEYEVKDSIVYSDDRNGGSKLDAHNSNTDGQNTENSSKLSENDVRSEIPPHHPKHTYC